MKLLFTSLIFLFLLNNLRAQTFFTLSGKVLNEITGAPMAATSVFAQSTTIGTITDDNGNFKLQLPQGGYDIIFTFTGYKTESRRITTADAGQTINIILREKEKEMETVAIISSNEVKDGLEKFGQFFNEEFIGKTINSKACTVQNLEALHFFFSKKKNRLKITATVPLLIKNNALGYNIKYSIDSFTHEYGTGVSIYSGYPLYEEMQGDSIQQQLWKANRQAAYKGSLLHFMRSLYQKKLKEQQFEMQFIVQKSGVDNALQLKDPYGAVNYEKDDSTQTVEIMPNQKEVGILFMGEKPGDIPVERAIKFEMIVNMKTAKTLGIKIPNSILVRATKVIE